MTEATIVIPCYNEVERLPVGTFKEFLTSSANVHLLFVDDGSTDGTEALIRELIDWRPDGCSLHVLPRNMGKAEAVRRGCLEAFKADCEFTGFWDADLATPLDVIPQLCQVLRDNPALVMVFGSRVRLLGREIERSAVRHYTGRVFATAVSLMLGIPVYDTQCGAKLFRRSSVVEQLMQEPFNARWVFDVEIIARLMRALGSDAAERARELIYEYPLHEWRDVAGSKLRLRDFVRAAVDVLKIRWRYLR
ncbi:MAG: glycosyltransferase [Gemmatimonadota bacterium]|nr:MAG: glycosyltransferase [Gemmatimonadota bacterium]